MSDNNIISLPVDGQLEMRFNVADESYELARMVDAAGPGNITGRGEKGATGGEENSGRGEAAGMAEGEGRGGAPKRTARVSLFRRQSKSGGGGAGVPVSGGVDGPGVWLPDSPHAHSALKQGYDRVSHARYEHGVRVLQLLEEENRGPADDGERLALYNVSSWAARGWTAGDHGNDVAVLVGELLKKHCPRGGKILFGGISSLSILSEIPKELLENSLVTIVTNDEQFAKAARHLVKGIDVREAPSVGEAGLISGFYDVGIFPQQFTNSGVRGDEVVSEFKSMKNLVSEAGVFYCQGRSDVFMDSENKTVQKFIQGLENEVELRGGIRKNYSDSTWSHRRYDHLVFASRVAPQATLPGQHFYAKLVSSNGRTVNAYFANSPEAKGEDMVLAKLASATPNRVYALDHYVDVDKKAMVGEEREEAAPADVGYLDYCIDEEGRIRQNINGTLAVVNIFGKEAKRLKGMINLRNEFKNVFSLRVGGGLEEFEKAKSTLLSHYEGFVKEFGALDDSGADKPQNALKYFRGSADRSLFCTIEQDYRLYKEGKQTVYNMDYVDHVPERLDDIEDAVRICYHQTGTVYPEQIAENLGLDKDEVLKQIGDKGLAFFNPEKDAWEPGELYLSGDIRKKLEVAKLYELANPSLYGSNVKALNAALPPSMSIDDVIGTPGGEDVSVGALARVSSWVPEDVLNNFARFAITGITIEVKRDATGRVSVVGVDSGGNRRNRWSGSGEKTETDVFSTKFKKSTDILRYAIQGTRPDFDPDAVYFPKGTKPADLPGLIDEAKADHDLVGRRVDDLNKFFVDWVNQNPEVREKMEKAYNESLNRYVPPRPDIERVSLEGLSPGFYAPDQHQVFAIARGLVQDGLILHHSPMLGKTFVMGAIANERWVKDRQCKTGIIVPKETFQQAVAEIRKAFPNLPICPCGPKDLTHVPIEQSLNGARLQQGGLVVFTSETFNDIPLPKEVELSPLYEKIAAKERALAFSENRDAEKDAKVMEDIRKLREQANKILTREEKIPYTVADFGFYGITVDEAHVFRNMSTNAPGGEGIAGAGKSDQLRDKIRYLRSIHAERHQGTGVPPFFTVLATGTMTGRKAVDIYNFIDLAAPQVLKSCNINTPRDFLNTFARQVVSFRGDPTRPGEQIRCTAYQLMPSPALSQILLAVADTVYAGDVPRVVSTKPKLHTGKAMLSVCPRSPSQEQYYHDIIKRAERNSGPGETLALYGEAVRVAVDARLIDPRLPDHQDSKVNRAVANIIDLYKQSEADRGCQLVFCENYSKKAEDPAKVIIEDIEERMGWFDVKDAQEKERVEKVKEQLTLDMQEKGIDVFRAPGGFPHPPFVRTPEMESVCENILISCGGYLKPEEVEVLKSEFAKILGGGTWPSQEYNLFRELKSKLVAGGVNEKEIAVVSEMPGAKRDAAKAAANTGAVRVLIGSRDVLGKGVNIQTRMIGDHSLDVTWNPDEEWQAQERGPRVGNIFPTFYRHRYVTKNSGEEIVALRNEQKQRSSIAIWLGAAMDAAKADAMEHLMSTAELTSVISGDFRAKLRAHLHTMVTSLEDQARGREHERSQALNEIPKVVKNFNDVGLWGRDDKDLSEIVASYKAKKLPTLRINGEEAKINIEDAGKLEQALNDGGTAEIYGMPLAIVEREAQGMGGHTWSRGYMNTYLTTRDGRYREIVGKEGVLGALRGFVSRVATAERRVLKLAEQEKSSEVKLTYLYQKSAEVLASGKKLERLAEIRDGLVADINDKSKPTWEREEGLLDDIEEIARRIGLKASKNEKEDTSGKKGSAFLEAMIIHYCANGGEDSLLHRAIQYSNAAVEGKPLPTPALGVENLSQRDLLVVHEGAKALEEHRKVHQTSRNQWGWGLWRKEREEILQGAEIAAAVKWEDMRKLKKASATPEEGEAKTKVASPRKREGKGDQSA